MTLILETKRLLLRQFELTDTAFIIKLLNTDEWIKYIGDRHIKTEAAARDYLLGGPLKSYESNGFGLSLVLLLETGAPIGMCGLIKRDTLEDIDIGFAFLPEYTGKGYGAEITEATLGYAQKTLGLKRVIAITLAENTSSIRLLKRSGMLFEKTIQMGDEELLQFGIDLNMVTKN